MSAPQKRYAHSACLAGNKMYVFGGQASFNPSQQKKGNLQTLYEVDFLLDKQKPPYLYKWEKIRADNPRARDSHTCIYVSILLLVAND